MIENTNLSDNLSVRIDVNCFPHFKTFSKSPSLRFTPDNANRCRFGQTDGRAFTSSTL